MSSTLRRVGSQVSAQSQSRQGSATSTFPPENEEGNETERAPVSESNLTPTGSADNDSARRQELKKLFQKYAPRFLRNRLANLNLAQDGLRPVLIKRLVDATLLLEKGVAPTTAATSTGEEVSVEVQLAAGANPVGQGTFSENEAINSPLRENRFRDSLQQYQAELEARDAPSTSAVIAANRKAYMEDKFKRQIDTTRQSMQEDEAKRSQIARQKAEEAERIRLDQIRLARAKTEEAEREEAERLRRISIHGGIDPLEKKPPNRKEQVAAIREELEALSAKQVCVVIATGPRKYLCFHSHASMVSFVFVVCTLTCTHVCFRHDFLTLLYVTTLASTAILFCNGSCET